jgi:homoserine O-acetyltransferase
MMKPPASRYDLCCLLFLAILLFPRLGTAYDRLVEKEVFTLPSFTTVGGHVLKDVRFGYEMYGHLNAAKDNAILILPYFSGTGHAAGKFAATDQSPGYWDSIIGSGKPLDTDRYCIIAGDGLINQTIKDGHTVTTGPASIDPVTGKPYGMRFPILTMRDLVNAQKALVDSLGIQRLRAVMGLSMGGAQSFEWAAVFPDSTDRVIPVVMGVETNGYLIGSTDNWSAPIKLDPKWNQGDYYGKAEPLDGLTAAFKMLVHEAQNYEGISSAVDRNWAEEGKDPAKSWDNKFMAQQSLDEIGKFLAQIRDANSFLYQVKVIQLFIAGGALNRDAGLAGIKAKLLILPAQSDIMIYPKYTQEAAERLRQLGKSVEYHEIPGVGGHFDAIYNISAVGDLIGGFLKQ